MYWNHLGVYTNRPLGLQVDSGDKVTHQNNEKEGYIVKKVSLVILTLPFSASSSDLMAHLSPSLSVSLPSG